MILRSAHAQETSHHKIAFASNIDGDWEIYLIDASGGNRTGLASSKWADYYPFPSGLLLRRVSPLSIRRFMQPLLHGVGLKVDGVGNIYKGKD